MSRKLFCEISPFTYRLSMEKEILKRKLKDFFRKTVSFNYIDYRVKNETDNTYQLRLWVDGEYLCGELRAAELQSHTFHIHAENEYFSREGDTIYRNGHVFRDVIDRVTGRHLESQLIRTNHAKVMYDLPPSITIREQ